MKILICDDDIYFAQCIYKFLQQIESEQNLLLEIQSFNNTEALLDVVKTDSEIKLIFLDIIFTGSKVNGIKIAKEIEKINYKVKIVFITSYDSFAIQGYQMNTVGYLMKPIEYNVFKEKFKTYLAQLDYEEKYFPIEKPGFIDILKLRMYEMGLTQKAMSELIGVSPSRLSNYLTGKSEPTLQVARRISKELNISADIVLGV